MIVFFFFLAHICSLVHICRGMKSLNTSICPGIYPLNYDLILKGGSVYVDIARFSHGRRGSLS